MREARTDRMNWLTHLHGCPECERRQPCKTGRALVEAVQGSMAYGESLDLARIGLVHAD